MARERKFTSEELYAAAKELMIQGGYEGFTFSVLAERLEVSRGALYKYYPNREQLIMEVMGYEMQRFIRELEQVLTKPSFEEQFDELIRLIFSKQEVHELHQVVRQMQAKADGDLLASVRQLERLPLEMYRTLGQFVQRGKQEGRLKAHLPDSILLGIIFQSIAIPNHQGIPQEEWVQAIKEILKEGMFQ